MQSFRTELEQAVSLKAALVEKDIAELGQKIAQFRNGTLHEDKFRALRLARGVYGQRQQGVQMIRIKLPFGKVTAEQLRRIAEVSDRYSNGRLHITTRQDIQIHHVSLDRTPQLWAELEKDDVTLREACGNTVRNVTASPIAGIDPDEPFDVAPYADLVYRYFLRKPFGQELGRKIKIAFSSNDGDDAYTFIHDFGFLPKIRLENGVPVKGFKVLVGGGLGAQPFLAQVAFEFLRAEDLLPFVEAAIRVFDRHGERNSRHKARLKYLVAKIGTDAFLELVAAEKAAVQFRESDFTLLEQTLAPVASNSLPLNQLPQLETDAAFAEWVQTNVFRQKQFGFVGVFVKVQLGNFTTGQASAIARLVERFSANDLRFTIDQSFLLRFVEPANLFALYTGLQSIGLADSGYDSVADVTACPGTDTCNLGISNSTEVARVVEQLVRDEYPQLLRNSDLKIKISGCMNSCGQHGLAHIGFHGSSMKVGGATVPALQVLLGGGKTGDGTGRIAEKVIKLPSRRVEDTIRFLLDDYSAQRTGDEAFNAYYDRRGNRYFYDLLKPLATTETLDSSAFVDWGQDVPFKTAIGVGECAGVLIDLVATLLFDADEKLASALEAFAENRFADAVYFAYAANIHVAKALLLGEKVQCNTHHGIIADFDKHLGAAFGFGEGNSFADFVLRLRDTPATQEFAESYVSAAADFAERAATFRKQEH